MKQASVDAALGGPRSAHEAALLPLSYPTMGARNAWRDRAALGALCLGLVGWAFVFIRNTTLDIDGQRVYCLFDDAMISMTYARNLVEGHGLNWARWGDPVEGYSHPLWVALMVPAHLLGLDVAKRSLVIQLLSLVFLLANLVAIRGLVLRHFSGRYARHWVPAAFLTAFYYPLNHWSLYGMETGLQALLIVLGIRWALDISLSEERPWGRLFTVLTAAALLRMDMALFILLCLAAVARHARWSERRAWLPGAAALVAVPLAYLAFRLAYFGAWLPNTYYMKMTGTPTHVRMTRGLLVFGDFLRPIFAPVIAAVAGAVGFSRVRPAYRLPLAVIAAYFAYDVYVGGDAWEWAHLPNRFVTPVMPLVFVLVNALLNDLFDAWAVRRPGVSSGALAGGVAVALLLVFNGMVAPDRPGDKWREMIGYNKPIHVKDHADYIKLMRHLEANADRDALVAVGWAGITSYFSSFRLADIFGYNDAYVANLPSVTSLEFDQADKYYPGHMKYDYDYTVGVMKPDIVVAPRSPRPPDLDGKLTRLGYVKKGEVWVRKDSAKVRL